MLVSKGTCKIVLIKKTCKRKQSQNIMQIQQSTMMYTEQNQNKQIILNVEIIHASIPHLIASWYKHWKTYKHNINKQM